MWETRSPVGTICCEMHDRKKSDSSLARMNLDRALRAGLYRLTRSCGSSTVRRFLACGAFWVSSGRLLDCGTTTVMLVDVLEALLSERSLVAEARPRSLEEVVGRAVGDGAESPRGVKGRIVMKKE